MKRFWKIIGFTAAALALLALGTLAAFIISVKPGVYIIQRMFDQPPVITDEAHYEDVLPLVTETRGLDYPSRYNENTFDLYYPKDAEHSLPVLFWVHGGGFVGGNTDGVREFALYIAAENKIAVAAVNYEKAPGLQYPGQLQQLEELYTYLHANQTDFPMLDFGNVLFGGDSARAQIAGQYTAIQTNKAYADEMDIQQIIPPDSLRAFISYSGPVDIEQTAESKSDSAFMKFFVNTVARAFIGTRNWKESSEIRQASVKNYVTEQFPPAYITDGNAFSFETQGKALEEKLKSLGIPVQSLFFTGMDKEIPHEYQFNYELDEAKESLQQTIEFIGAQLGQKEQPR